MSSFFADPPATRMMIFPSTATENVTNVTLICEIENANPYEVTSIRWYQNGENFSLTNETNLVLTKVDRTYHSNYSCQAENRVGWGEISAPQLLNIFCKSNMFIGYFFLYFLNSVNKLNVCGIN